jgi:hypothetical protein
MKELSLVLLLLLGGCAQSLGPAKPTGTSAVVVSEANNGQASATNWGSCGSTACAGGAGNSTSLTQAPGIASPSVSGASMSLAFTSPASGNNALFYWKPATCDTCTWVRFETEVYVPSGVANYEFDSFIVTPTLDGMFGKQCNTVSGYWQYANQTSAWTNGPIPCVLSTGAWHHLIFSDSWDPSDTSCSSFPTLRFGSITIDGVVNSWAGTTICATAIPGGWTHTFGCQFQMDSSSAATLTEYVDDVNCWGGN